LKNAIKSFEGTAIIVSHDREFLDGLVTKVYEFGNGKVREHLGGIYDFLRNKINPSSDVSQNDISIHDALISNEVKPDVPSKSTKEGHNVYAEHKEQQKVLRRTEKAVKESETKIASMEARVAELDKLFSLSENASDMTLVTEYTTTKQALDKENEQWLKLSEKLETLKTNI
jgi:ATP-binding cassette subfamily F protein 3